jgi:hypothetical protein
MMIMICEFDHKGGWWRHIRTWSEKAVRQITVSNIPILVVALVAITLCIVDVLVSIHVPVFIWSDPTSPTLTVKA